MLFFSCYYVLTAANIRIKTFETNIFRFIFVFLFLHHLVRISLPILHSDLHKILPRREALQVDAFQFFALCANEAALQVVKLDLGGLHVGRVLQVDLVLCGVGVEQVGTDEGFRFG